jgi:hypothetical protein
MISSPYFNSILNTEPCLEMPSSHSPSTSETTIDRKVRPVATHSDIETAALPGVLEVERLTKSVMYIFASVFEKKNMANTIYLFLRRRKVDWRMLPLLGILSALSLIDRSNLGLARASGMDQDLVFLFFSFQLGLVLTKRVMQGFKYWVSLQHCFLHIFRSLYHFVSSPLLKSLHKRIYVNYLWGDAANFPAICYCVD